MDNKRLIILPVFLLLSFLLAQPKTVAISYFDNTSGLERYNPLSKGLADMLITDLSNIESIQIVEREKLEEIIQEQNLALTGIIDESKAAQVGKLLGAKLILTGSFLIMGETMRIDARLLDVSTGKVIMAKKIEGKKNSFFQLEKDLVKKLISTLDLKLTRGETRKINKVQTESFESFSAYSSGLDAFDNGEYVMAMKSMEEAVEFDEGFDIAWDKLDDLEKNLSDFMKTRSLGLSMELIKEIDALSKGDKSYCDAYASKNWQIYYQLSGAGKLGSFAFVNKLKYSADKADESTWQKVGFTKKLESYDEFCIEYGKMLNHAFGSVEYVLSKNIPDEPCGLYSPNESALAMISMLLNGLHIMFGNSNRPPDVLDGNGGIRINGDQYDKLLIKYGSDYIRRFPYSFYVDMIEPTVQEAIKREKG